MKRAIRLCAVFALATGLFSCGSSSPDSPVDGGVTDGATADTGTTAIDAQVSTDSSGPDASTFGCGPGTLFCSSSCGICILAGAMCRVNTCIDANGGQPCGDAPCGTGTHCVSNQCVPQ